MRIISIKLLQNFWSVHADAEQPLRAWYTEASHANWKSPQDVKAVYASASILQNNRVCFNIKGNEYRLIVAMAYQYGAGYVKFIGTHAAYDKIDAHTVDQGK